MSNTAPSAIRFTEEHVTVATLARQLGKKTHEMLQELIDAGERPVYGKNDGLSTQSILGWGTIQKACKKEGFEAIDERQPPKSASISKDEWNVLRPAAKEAAGFHRTYGESLQEMLKLENPTAAKELAQFHNDSAAAIEETIKQIDLQLGRGKKVDEPDTPSI